jgi:hypothetical protein
MFNFNDAATEKQLLLSVTCMLFTGVLTAHPST